MIINTAAGGALMNKNLEEAQELLDKILSNHYQWQSSRGTVKRIQEYMSLDTVSAIQAQLVMITKRLGTTTVTFIQTSSSCDFCGGGMKAILSIW